MKDNQHEQLFTELTSAEAAAVEGGAYFNSTVAFDADLYSRTFYVKPGGNIFLSANTSNSRSTPANKLYSVSVYNTDTYQETSPKFLSVGNDSESWRGMRGGNYKLHFTDTADGNAVEGSVLVSYDS